MKLLISILALEFLHNPVLARAESFRDAVDTGFEERGIPDAPSGYTPKAVGCPSKRPSIRSALKLSPEESAWLKNRRPKARQAMRELLERLDIKGFDAASYFDKYKNDINALPNLGIAASGGGYRALMNGAGNLAAFDSRTENSTSPGGLGGVLQSATYLSGLSGGSWLVGSLYSNNFTTVQSIIDGKEGPTWDFTNSIFEGPDSSIQVLGTIEYFHTIIQQVQGKEDAGFETSLTDFWGRGLAFQLLDAKNGGPAYTWSSIGNNDFIKQGDAPLPIAIADSRAPKTRIIPTNTTIYEFNPWEMGSWDPTVFGFAPMKYVGSSFEAGHLPSDKDCVEGYDSASFIMGTSSTLFNQFAVEFGNQFGLPDIVQKFIQHLLNDLSRSEDDIAQWINPFYRWNPTTNPNGQDTELSLVDGGENLENLPLHPLVQPRRNVDVIVAIDSSADTFYYWPNGTSLVASYQRSLNTSLANGTAFPSIPDQNTFVNLGLNARPTFFGCPPNNISNPETQNEFPPPLIVYLPHAPYTAFSNVSTFNPQYTMHERNAYVQNGYNVATRGNSSVDNWPTCMGCALLKRSFERTKTEFPTVCQQCYDLYCWDGTVNSTRPARYDPSPYDVSSKQAKANAAGGTFTSLGSLTMSSVLLCSLIAAAVTVL